MENHSDISKNFIPYDLALELKALGFNEECFAWYNMSQDNLCFFGNDCCADMYAGEELRPEAPLWQQAFDWFLNRGYFADIKPDLIVTSLWSYKVVDINGKYNPENLHYYRFTYYRDARLECLKKLIEIAKEQNVK